MAPDSPLQNEVANLERQVLEAKKAALQKQLQTLTAANPGPPTKGPAANQGEAKNSNSGLFYEHEGEESHLVSPYAQVSVSGYPTYSRHKEE